jgi:hypothetical protein
VRVVTGSRWSELTTWLGDGAPVRCLHQIAQHNYKPMPQAGRSLEPLAFVNSLCNSREVALRRRKFRAWWPVTAIDQTKGGKMLKKLLVGVIAAGALSVPLAGVAWGEPANPDENPIGPGGVPGKISRIVQAQGAPVEGNVPPGTGSGEVVLGTSDIAQMPGSVPDVTASFGVSNPGSVVQAVTPGCVNGSVACQFNPS